MRLAIVGDQNAARGAAETHSPDAYLAREREAESRHEYLDGEMLALAGASLRHSLILTNTLSALGKQLEDGRCFAVPNDLRVRTPDRSLYAYPDIVAWCGEPALEDDREDTLTNPVLIVEILSPSTEAFCRGEKLARYRTIPSLVCYLLVAQHRMRVERYVRDPEAADAEAPSWWQYQAFDDPADLVTLPRIECALRLGDLYRGVASEVGSVV